LPMARVIETAGVGAGAGAGVGAGVGAEAGSGAALPPEPPLHPASISDSMSARGIMVVVMKSRDILLKKERSVVTLRKLTAGAQDRFTRSDFNAYRQFLTAIFGVLVEIVPLYRKKYNGRLPQVEGGVLFQLEQEAANRSRVPRRSQLLDEQADSIAS